MDSSSINFFSLASKSATASTCFSNGKARLITSLALIIIGGLASYFAYPHTGYYCLIPGVACVVLAVAITCCTRKENSSLIDVEEEVVLSPKEKTPVLREKKEGIVSHSPLALAKIWADSKRNFETQIQNFKNCKIVNEAKWNELPSHELVIRIEAEFKKGWFSREKISFVLPDLLFFEDILYEKMKDRIEFQIGEENYSILISSVVHHHVRDQLQWYRTRGIDRQISSYEAARAKKQKELCDQLFGKDFLGTDIEYVFEPVITEINFSKHLATITLIDADYHSSSKLLIKEDKLAVYVPESGYFQFNQERHKENYVLMITNIPDSWDIKGHEIHHYFDESKSLFCTELKIPMKEDRYDLFKSPTLLCSYRQQMRGGEGSKRKEK